MRVTIPDTTAIPDEGTNPDERATPDGETNPDTGATTDAPIDVLVATQEPLTQSVKRGPGYTRTSCSKGRREPY